MKFTWDQQEEQKKHERMSGFLDKILLENSGFEETVLKGVRDYLRPILSEFGFEDVKYHIEVGPYEFYEAARDYKAEILFVMDEKKKRFDPSWKHNLMLKQISTMTGYEYKQYLEIIDNKPNADFQMKD